ncbi:MAG: hypothetical protein ACOYYJ_12135 [Chloroflexota bacterium]
MKIVKIRIIRSFATFALRRCMVEKKRVFRETCTEPVEVSVYKRVLITPIPNEPFFVDRMGWHFGFPVENGQAGIKRSPPAWVGTLGL